MEERDVVFGGGDLFAGVLSGKANTAKRIVSEKGDRKFCLQAILGVLTSANPALI